MDKILAEFGVQPVLLAAQVVNFLILLFILKKFLYKPILKVLETRKDRIAQSLKQAEEIEKRLREIGELQELEIQKATKVGLKIIEDSTASANQLYEDTKIKAQALSERVAKDLQLQFQMEKQKFEGSMREEVAELIFTVIQKVTGKILTKEDQKRIAQESLKILKS